MKVLLKQLHSCTCGVDVKVDAQIVAAEKVGSCSLSRRLSFIFRRPLISHVVYPNNAFILRRQIRFQRW
jgi:hypothetical protein